MIIYGEALAGGSTIPVAVDGVTLDSASPDTAKMLLQHAQRGLTIQQPAAGAHDDSPPFLVGHIEIIGNSLLSTAELHALVEQSEGKTLNLGYLEELAAVITKRYQDRGYLLSRAYIPSQTLSDGTVRIAVLESRYGAVSLSNSSRVSDALLKSYLTPLRSGQPVAEDALERRLLKATEPVRPVCTRCGFVFYLDPKIAVGTIIRTESGRIVLVRRAIEPGYGKWVFPGGYVDRGEPLTSAAIREAREECGLEVRLDSLVNIYSYPGRAPVIVVYAATAISGALCVDDECLELHPRWISGVVHAVGRQQIL